jgi:hypothetical protein
LPPLTAALTAAPMEPVAAAMAASAAPAVELPFDEAGLPVVPDPPVCAAAVPQAIASAASAATSLVRRIVLSWSIGFTPSGARTPMLRAKGRRAIPIPAVVAAIV